MKNALLSMLLAVIGLAATSALAPATASAQSSFKAGDKIEVFFLNDWTPAVVVQTNQRGDVMAEYEFAGGSQRKVFKAQEVRFQYLNGAISRPRFWEDASGKFKIHAVLMAIDGENVKLRKKDMSDIDVALKDLSEADKEFVKTVQEGGGPTSNMPPQHPQLEDFAGAGLGSFAVSFAGGAADRQPISPDPMPAYLKLKQGGVAFGTDSVHDRLGAVLPLGGPDAWILAALENASPSQGLPTRLLWVSLTKQKVAGRVLLPVGEAILDYHPPTRRLLTYGEVKGSSAWPSPALTLWEVSPTDKQAKAIVRWKADSGESVDPWARIIDGSLVIHRFKKQEYVCWDASGKTAKYRINQESFFAPLPVLSGGRKYLVMPEDTGVRIIEAATGNIVSSLPAKNGASGVALSEDGTRLAVLEDNDLVVWNLTSAETGAEPERYQAEAIGTPFAATLFWVGDNRVMADNSFLGQVLFSLNKRIALWNYQFDHNAVHDHGSRRLRDIVDKHLVYAATVQAGSQSGLAVGAVQLPGPKVDEVDAATDPETLYVIKPGTEMRLQVDASENTERVRAAMEAEIKKNGWVLSENAKFTLVAEMKIGETQTTTYSSFGFGGASESVSVTPYISSARILMGEQVCWSGGTSTGAPPILMLREGQTVQSEVDKWQKPHPEFFDTVDIPEKILDPAKRNGLGSTQVTNRGLIPK